MGLLPDKLFELSGNVMYPAEILAHEMISIVEMALSDATTACMSEFQAAAFAEPSFPAEVRASWFESWNLDTSFATGITAELQRRRTAEWTGQSPGLRNPKRPLEPDHPGDRRPPPNLRDVNDRVPGRSFCWHHSAMGRCTASTCAHEHLQRFPANLTGPNALRFAKFINGRLRENEAAVLPEAKAFAAKTLPPKLNGRQRGDS
ncbi:MAG: hypothetical protein AAF311_17510 [Pseudomonadota bacterium]